MPYPTPLPSLERCPDLRPPLPFSDAVDAILALSESS